MGLRRRDLLRGGALLAVGLAGARAGIGALWGPRPSPQGLDPARLTHLSAAQEGIVVACAEVMLGRAGRAALAAGWDVAAGVDRLLGGLAPDQRRLLGVGLHLLEEWSLSPRGFSARGLEEREAWLGAWAVGNPTQRGIWGFLHAAICSAFASDEAGWAHMGYPGPCVAGAGGAGRPPGQSALYTWDEAVP